MPRPYIEHEPEIINSIIGDSISQNTLQIATTNPHKLKEFKRLMPGYEIVGIKLDVEEVQSLDPQKVAAEKAKLAWKENGYNPILVEDSSLDIAGLNKRPGTLVSFFMNDPQMRKEIAEVWLKGKDRRVTARAILAIYDGKEAHLFEGVTKGTIAETPKGDSSFGFDDIFIPDGYTKTFGEMTSAQKDNLSHRTKAVKEFLKAELKLYKPVLKIPEPFHSEMLRLDINKLQDPKALRFAYLLEAVNGSKPSKEFEATKYEPIIEEVNPYYYKYDIKKNSPSIGIVYTDVDRVNTKQYKNGDPILWQYGPERRKLALAQRAEYYLKNTDKKVVEVLNKLEKGILEIPHRRNRRDPAVETLLGGGNTVSTTVYARANKELGYKKLSASKEVSRNSISKTGLYNIVGKYPRLIYGMGSMPAVSGWKDAITTAIISHIPVFITRNSIYAGNNDLRLQLIKEVQKDILSIKMGKKLESMVLRNIGVALGASNAKEVADEAEYFYKKANIKLFRIYTINSDPRVIESAKVIRQSLGDDVEIFVGQIADIKQARALVEQAQIDALIFGHGGGRQCTSATNGMAISTVEEIYSIIKDDFFNDTSLIVEGGVGKSVGALFILGVDAILYNQQFTKGTIEVGGILLQKHNGMFVQPYHGSASSPTMIIEAANKKMHSLRINPSGRTRIPEGKPGYSKYSEKANSMAYWIDEFKHQAARTLADLGVENISELREFLQKSDLDLIRIVSPEAAHTASAYGAKS